MNAKMLTIAGAALAVLILARMAGARTSTAEYANNPQNWNYIRGYTPGSGYYS